MANLYDNSTSLKHKPRGVMLSEEYFTEVIDLMNDPILQEMADEILTYDPMAMEGQDLHSLTMAVNAEYKRRGGTRFRTIGGPLWALRELVTARKDK